MKDLAFAQTNEGDVVRVVTVEEQEIRENQLMETILRL